MCCPHDQDGAHFGDPESAATIKGADHWGRVGDVDAGLVDPGQRLSGANRTRIGHSATGDTKPGHKNWVYGRASRVGAAIP
jgi:hypothetical protein